MKTNLLVSVVIVISFFFGMSSCSKETDESIAPKEEVIKIFMSAPQGQSGLKSASMTKNEISQGDTIYVQDIKDVNIIVSAEDEIGSPIKGSWSIFNVKNDRDINKSDTIAIGSGGYGGLGSVISTKLKFLGLYTAIFTSKDGNQVSFSIIHKGMPGILGDNWENDYAFRLDKEIYQINNVDGNTGYTLYLKYEEGEFPILTLNGDTEVDLNATKNFHALLFCSGNNIFVSKGGYQYQARGFNLKKCKYSPGYVCFSFLSESTPPQNGQYAVNFYTGTFGENYWFFQSIWKSDWSKDGRIVFQVVN